MYYQQSTMSETNPASARTGSEERRKSTSHTKTAEQKREAARLRMVSLAS